MDISTLRGSISIKRKIYDDDSIEINLCKYDRSSKQQDDELNTLIVLKNPEIIKNTIKVFYSLKENEKFNDFIECFSQNSYLYIVFKYYNESPINYEEILIMPLMQRVEITKQLLSLVVLLDIPKPILYDIFSSNNINLDSSGTIYFNYYLRNITLYKDLTDRDAIRKIGVFFKKVFSSELMESSVIGLNKIVSGCENGKYKNVIDIYSDYVANYENFIKSVENKQEKKETFIKKIMNTAISIFNKVKLIAIVIALSIGVVYLIVSITGNKEKKVNKVIETIGTQQVYEDKKS